MSIVEEDFRPVRTASSLPLGRVLLALACWAPWEFALALAMADEPAPVEFASARVSAQDGASIHYLLGGAASAKAPVVFIPGWTWSAATWEEQMRRLAPSRRVVAMDPRSQGDSSKTADGNTPEHRAGDVQALLQALGDDPVVLVGWSQGVQDVAAYVDRFGTARLAGIVLVDSALSAGPASFEVDPEGTRQFLQRIAIYAEYPDEYMAGMLDASVLRKFPPAEKSRQVELRRKTPTSTGISMLVTDALTTDRRGVAAKISVPTLVVASASSSELALQKELAAKIPGASLSVIDDAGHAVFLDQPMEFARALSTFLDTIAPASPQVVPIRKR